MSTRFPKASEVETLFEALANADQLRDRGDVVAAISAYQTLISQHGNIAEPYYKLGTVYMQSGQDAQAESCLRAALDLRRNYPEASNNLGVLIERRGESAKAENLFRLALSQNSDYFQAHLNLGCLLKAQARLIEARYSLTRALTLQPDSAVALEQLGSVLFDLGLPVEAKELLLKAVEAAPTSAAAWIWLGRCHSAFRNLDDADQCASKAIALDPYQLSSWHNLLLASNWRNKSFSEVYLQHLAFGDHLQQTLGVMARTQYANSPRRQRKLRIGFVSGDLRRHSVSYFVEACIKHFNASKFESWAYYNHPQADSRSAELHPFFTEWRSIFGLNDIDVAAMIERDGIDILIDLSGHTGYSRLDVFAHKPAPVQVSWIGYPNTTGLKTIDYRITDAIVDPIGEADTLHVENLVRLPDCFLCYTPPREAPDLATLPMLSNGYVTFGSFNGRVKITDETLALWQKVLTAVPDSRLVVKSVAGIGDDIGKHQLIEQMTSAGIDPQRVNLLSPKESTADHLAVYHQIDIGLDTTPYNGTTTTCEALWMGVPVITLRGDRHASRVGASLLINVGLGDLVATSDADYVGLASQLANDPARLSELRQNMRKHLIKSPLLDAVRSTRHLEAALRKMWIAYCEQARKESKSEVQLSPHRAEVWVAGGHRVCISAEGPKTITGWVLLEQEDWFEDDIRFLRRICKSNWHALDIGANHGVYALAIAASGAQKVWAFEPVSTPRLLLRDSIALNHFDERITVIPLALSHSAYSLDLALASHSELHSLHDAPKGDSGKEKVSVAALDDVIENLGLGNTRFDFVKIDAEGEESAILRGGLRFFLDQSPLVMYEARNPAGVIQTTVGNTLRAMGYDIYRLIPGIACLVPVAPAEEATLDSFTLNLYACKPPLANALEAQGYLVTTPTEVDDAEPESLVHLMSLPAIQPKMPAEWQTIDLASAYGRALLSWCKSQQSDHTPAVRFGHLNRALGWVQQAVDSDDNHPAVAALGIRLCADAGLRNQGLAIASAFLEQMSAGDEFPVDRPLPPIYDAFDEHAPAGSLGPFLYQSLVEFRLDRGGFSNCFVPSSPVDFVSGLANPEHTARFERTAVMCHFRNGSPLALPASAKLFCLTPDNLNAELWQRFAASGDLLKLSTPPSWSKNDSTRLCESQRQLDLDRLCREIEGLISVKEFDAALDLIEAKSAVAADSAKAMKFGGIAAQAMRQHGLAQAHFRQALSIAPNDPELHTLLGNLLAEGGQTSAAEAAYRNAIELDSTYLDAHVGIGVLHLAASDLDQAELAFKYVLARAPTHVNANHQLGALYHRRGDLARAQQLYLCALEADANHYATLNNLGGLQLATQQLAQAKNSLERAISTTPGLPDAHNNLGLVHLRMNQHDEAEVAFKRAIELQPEHAGALLNLGVLQKERGDFAAAERSLRLAAKLTPNSGNALAQAYYCARHRCDWSQLEADEAQLKALLSAGIADIPPFIFVTTEDSGSPTANSTQLLAGQQYSAQRYAHVSPLAQRGGISQGNDPRLCIGYLSSDFRAHATVALLRGVLREHDRTTLRVCIYSTGAMTDQVTAEVQDSSEVFRDLSGVSDQVAADVIRADDIDILVDLKGFTHDNRLGICAYRPAPVIVSWLGYPATLGAPQLADYVIGDPVVTPLSHQPYFSEQIIQLPHCYQPNDDQRLIGSKPTRTALGLPEHALVLCCFNSAYKISPMVLEVWCQLLSELPGSVLWLVSESPEAMANLRRVANAYGIDSDRLIFAPHVSQTEHLARIQLADIALDTYPCCSHTTASDALWAGVPLVTLMGETFVSRVAGSLLTALGVPELIARTWDDYRTLVHHLGTSAQDLASLRAKISHLRKTSPLFDTQGFTTDLENLYADIWNRYQRQAIRNTGDN